MAVRIAVEVIAGPDRLILRGQVETERPKRGLGCRRLGVSVSHEQNEGDRKRGGSHGHKEVFLVDKGSRVGDGVQGIPERAGCGAAPITAQTP
jgi:hypothetical protein